MIQVVRRRSFRPIALAAAAALVVAGLGTSTTASADPPGKRLNSGPQKLSQAVPTSEPGGTSAGGKYRPRTALPTSGRYSFLVQLDARSTGAVFQRSRSTGTSAAKKAAKNQLAQVKAAQRDLVKRLPAGSTVLYRVHSALAGLAVTTDVRNFAKLKSLPGVAAVHPIAPKTFSNAYAVPLQGAPAVWSGRGDLGQNVTVAVIDTGIDYTHANFGGPGTAAAYETAHAAEDSAADSALFPSDKIIGGYDLAGDAYNADPESPDDSRVPRPDPNPLDCNGHGSHVAGTAAGLGENGDGSTYTGGYDADTPFDSMKIGPGMAPAAKLLAYRVFGCEGSSDLVGAAIDMAADPNGDGDPSDHVDVINMSLGGDYGSPQDGDSILSNAAVDLGITVAVASGNAGDLTDVGGSPGDAAKVITVANSRDASNVEDGVSVKIGSAPAKTYAASRAVRYDWSTKPDLSGTVVLRPDDNTTACTAFSAADAAAIEGKVVLVEWNEDDLACGSIQASGNLRDAGAIGFLFANLHESFAAGINGDDQIPGVVVAKSGADAIRAALSEGTTVTVNKTSVSSVEQMFPEDNDKINASSSRGIHAAGNVKPDVTAVGTTVFSTAVGTGDEGASLTGTSMATPMVAGLAALIRSAHPDWTPNQVKADIMNTAGQDISVNGSAAGHPGDLYGPVRAGAGRVKADAALNNSVLAYNITDSGTVSVSFGPVAVTGPTAITKTVRVDNRSLSTVSYDAGYDAITSVPGVEYLVSPASLTISPRSSKTLTVTFSVTDPTLLSKTVDPTIGRTTGAGYPRETLAEAMGRLLLTPTAGSSVTLRVPVYSAPRPASTLSQARSLTLPHGKTGTASLSLTGNAVDNIGHSASEDIASIGAGFELQATSGRSPECSASITVACYRLAEEKAADVKYLGATSDHPLYNDPTQSQAYFAVSTHAAWSTPASKITFQYDLDVDNDRQADLYLYNTRLGGDDLFVSELYDPEKGVVDDQLINGRFGDVDTALYDSDTMVLPLLLGALTDYGVTADHPVIHYGVETYSAYSPQPIDLVGVDPRTGRLTGELSANLYRPGVTVTDSSGGPLIDESAGEPLTVTRDLASYRAEHGKGLLMVHFHNQVGKKAQVVNLKSAVSVAFSVGPTTLSRGAAITAKITVTDPDGGTPTGTVRLVHPSTTKTLVSGSLSGGRRTLTYKPTSPGTLTLQVVYEGSSAYLAGASSTKAVTVRKTRPSISLSFSPTTGNHEKTTTATVKIKKVLDKYAGGQVTLRRLTGSGSGVVARAALSNGSAEVKFKPKAGSYTYRVDYVGDSRYASGSSSPKGYRAS